MQIQIVDNGERNTISVLAPAIEAANDIRIAVAFVSGDGLSHLYTLCRKTSQSSLLCLASRNASAIYHPRMYLARNSQTATAIIGSSNLT